MTERPGRPSVADVVPTDEALTHYDRAHFATYLRMLDAAKAEAPWRDVVRIVLDIDPILEPERAKRAYDSHLARAQWMAAHGYRELLQTGDR